MTGAYQLNDEEIDKVAAYLMELKLDKNSGDVEKMKKEIEAEENEDNDEGGDK